MARTIKEIYDVMIQEKQRFSELNELQPNVDSSQRLLSDLTSTSKVATWRLFYWVIAVCVWTIESLFDTHSAEITHIVQNNHYGNRTWYEIKAKEFQKGDTLVVINGIVRYAHEDVTKRVVKYAATVPGAVIQVKIAGEKNGELEKIDGEVVLLVQDYFNKIKPFGTRVSVTSNNADTLKIAAKIFYNPLVLRPTGENISNGTYPVETAINQFLKSIEFDGKLNIQQLTDAIQKVEGVEDIYNLHVEARYGETDYVPVERQYFSFAGWMVVDSNFPLQETLEFEPNV